VSGTVDVADVAPDDEVETRPKAAPAFQRRMPLDPGRTVVRVFLLAAVVYFLIPAYWLLVASTKSIGDLYDSPGFLFAGFHLWDNLVNLTKYDGGVYWRWLLNSAIYSGVGAILMTTVSIAAGYALAVYEFRAKTLVFGITLGSMLIPQTVLAQPIYRLLVAIGLSNTYWGVLLPQIVFPFGVILAVVYARSSLSREIVEAARLDGASEWRIFRTIAVPLMIPGSVTILLFAFIGSWNNYLLPVLVLNDSSLWPVTVGLSGWNQSSVTIPGLQTLTIIGALMSILPLVVIFVSLQRYWKKGLDITGDRF
jgi:multiple sugar transport system permease protein